MQYVKIKDAIVEQIESGMLSARQKLPSERKLAESFSTTRVTLREALSLLEAEGRLYREDRRGWFIAPNPLRYNPSQPLGFYDLALAQNRVPSNVVLSAKAMLANKDSSRLLNLAPFSDVFCIERVRCLESRPVAHVTNYVHPERCPNLLQLDLTTSLTQAYRAHYSMEYHQVHYHVSISILSGEIAQALRATVGTPAMKIERTHKDAQGNTIDCQVEYWRHDGISIESVSELCREN
ncbi:phosphonate utilization transcriptional regulator PhnR [Vibrio renipiscarius]|uniref:GntR family transcriptional regulator n=1 Tax=Vibrio renipiscarius TaxID=1461322 RepID=A0A0C2P659_9VIBR|nr:phosphonate utilization transcriptional regulator PhnR [Vibrio renipiscarius]KII75628.1 GntR family transcriptional regulator [Vibrio renipiscarius]KII81922.1 GntR family transcriptional regulator [Vibrio renipiscarius]